MSLNGKQICFTGTLQMKRDDAKAQAEAAGAKVTGSVSANTDILVCGAGVGAKKTDDAQKKGVEVWTEDQFTSALSGGGGGGGGSKAAKKTTASETATAAPAASGGGRKKKATVPPVEEAEQPAAKKGRGAKKAPAPPGSPVASKGKGKAPAPPSSPPASAVMNSPTSPPRTPGVDRGARNLGATVFGEYDAKLNQTVVDGPVNSNKFYILQVLYDAHTHTCMHACIHTCIHTSNT
jgi:hypothetical protein